MRFSQFSFSIRRSLMNQRLTPKYITPALVERVVDMVLSTFMFSPQMDGIILRQMCHIVVLVPSVEDARGERYLDWPNYPIIPVAIFEKSVGNQSEWSRDYKSIAQCKAQQLWRGQNTDGNTDSVVHLLFSDDTPFWGGVRRHEIVVACSGVQSYFDQMISGMIADGIKAFARHAYEGSDDKKEGRTFLS